MPNPTTLTAVMDMLGLTGPFWAAWKVVCKVLDAQALMPEEVARFTRCAGRSQPPIAPPSEMWLLCGRRAGKSRFAGTVAVHAAAFRRYRAALAPGASLG